MYFVLVVLLSFGTCSAAQILGIFPIKSRSHHSMNQRIMKSLAARGHNITLISHFKSTDVIPNYTEIILPENEIVSYVDSVGVDELDEISNLFLMIRNTRQFEILTCSTIMSLDHIQRVLQSRDRQVDLVIAETFFTQCINLLSDQLDAPVIITQSAAMAPIDFMMGGGMNDPSYIPVMATPHTSNMDFWQRLSNWAYHAIYFIARHTVLNDYMAEFAVTYFNKTLPSEKVLNNRVALLLCNNHFTFITRPLLANVVDVAGIHIQEPNPLSKELRSFIDGADHGVLFFSFGTTIKASSMSTEKLNILKNVFSKIPQRILWRSDKTDLIDILPNVKINKWFPQRDILEHKNVRAFISHCGLFGTLEAIHTGTPVIAIPLAFDQRQNANILCEKQAAIIIDYFSMTEVGLLSTIDDIINNTKYSENMQKLRQIMNDRPSKTLDTALYWIEYVLRHNGAPHLRSVASDMPLYTYLLLDILVLGLIILCVTLWLCKNITRKFVLLFCRKNNNKVEFR